MKAVITLYPPLTSRLDRLDPVAAIDIELGCTPLTGQKLTLMSDEHIKVRPWDSSPGTSLNNNYWFTLIQLPDYFTAIVENVSWEISGSEVVMCIDAMFEQKKHADFVTKTMQKIGKARKKAI